MLDFLEIRLLANELSRLLAGTWYLPPSRPVYAAPRPRSVADCPSRKALCWMTFFIAHSVKGYLR